MNNIEIFPYTAPTNFNNSNENKLPLYKEIAWDFVENKPLIQNGTFVIVEGNEAIKIWIYKTLLTERFKFEIYTNEYGCEVINLIGQGYTKGYSEAEALRYCKEALSVNRYILDVKSINSNFSSDQLELELTVLTIYGEVSIDVRGHDAGIFNK